MNLIKAFPFPIREVQTDNGTEWTTALLVKDKTSKTLFEKTLETMDIISLKQNLVHSSIAVY